MESFITVAVGSTSPTMAYGWTVQESNSCSSSWVSQLVFSIRQNPEELGCNASEGIIFARKRESTQANRANFLLPCPYIV